MAVIYKVFSISNPDKVYIGSTIQKIGRRLQAHFYLKDTSCKEIFESGKDIIIEEIDHCEIKDRFIKEQEWIDKTNSVNKYKSYITQEQKNIRIKKYQEKYRQENKETNSIYQKEYKKTENYKESIKKYKSKKIKCENCLKEITQGYKNRHKQFCKNK